MHSAILTSVLGLISLTTSPPHPFPYLTHTEIVRLLRQVDAQIFSGWGGHEVCVERVKGCEDVRVKGECEGVRV